MNLRRPDGHGAIGGARAIGAPLFAARATPTWRRAHQCAWPDQISTPAVRQLGNRAHICNEKLEPVCGDCDMSQ